MSWLIVWLLGAAVAWAEPPPDPLSVYHVRPSLDLGITAGAAAGAAAIYGFRADIIDDECPCNPDRINAFDRSTVSNDVAVPRGLTDAAVGVAVIGPGIADWIALRGHRRVFKEDLLVYAQTIAVELAVVNAVQYTVQRPTPRAYAGDPVYVKFPAGYGSMYSAEAALTSGALTAAAMTASLRYGFKLWPWLLAAGAGVGVGMMRVAAGAQFPTDVGVGAAAGMAIGAGVPWLHRRRRSLVGPYSVELLPQPAGLALRVRF